MLRAILTNSLENLAELRKELRSFVLSAPLTTAYTYAAGRPGENSTSPLVESITQLDKTTVYGYDDCGNIRYESENGVAVAYAYDPLGQLIRVNDPYDGTAGNGTTWEYEYDQGGNILNKRAYTYTDGAVGTPVQTVPYTYGDSNWKDKLTAYNNSFIAYDAIGNPLGDGTWTYTWAKGRQLQSMSKAGETVSFTYNADGLRVRKVATTTGVTDYTLHGKNVVHLTNGTNSLHFYYDAQNRPAVVEFNWVPYAYVHNLQGDIIAIVDSAGTEMVEYKYDAWGRPIAKTGSLASTLGTLNPFRYRGYVYDEETGLCYCQTRYYSSETTRFINSDELLECGKGYVSANVFMYCQNNPANRIDECGTESLAAPVWQYVKQNGMNYATADGPLPFGDAVMLGVCIVGGVLSIVDIGIDAVNYFTSPAVTVTALSKKIDWGSGKTNHVRHGSANHGGHDWSPFGIGPEDPQWWDKLLPLLKVVADQGQSWQNPNSSKPIENIEYYIHYFEEYGASIVLMLFNQGGHYSISDAFPLR